MNNLAVELNKLIDSGSRKYPIPYKKGNSIRMGKIVIRAGKSGYILFDCEINLQICTTFSKYGALAAAKKYLKGEDLSFVLMLDEKYQKHKNDAEFYKHSIKNSNNEQKKEVVESRLDLSEAYKESAAYDLETIIFE